VRDDAAREAQLLKQMWSMDAADRAGVQLDRAALFVRLGRIEEAKQALQAADIQPSCEAELKERAAAVEARIDAAEEPRS